MCVNVCVRACEYLYIDVINITLFIKLIASNIIISSFVSCDDIPEDNSRHDQDVILPDDSLT